MEIPRFPPWRYASWLDHEWLSSHSGGQKVLPARFVPMKPVDVGYWDEGGSDKYMYIQRWWFQICFYVHPYLGKWSNLTIFFRWVETTNMCILPGTQITLFRSERVNRYSKPQCTCKAVTKSSCTYSLFTLFIDFLSATFETHGSNAWISPSIAIGPNENLVDA